MDKTRTVLITGAASGIGKALATSLAEQGRGLVLVDIDPRIHDVGAALREQGADVLSDVADISQPDPVRAVVARGLEHFGSIDGLVNNAGIVDNIRSVEQMKFEAWQREVGVNLTGVFNLLQAVLPGMRRQEYGRIVNVSSAAARSGLMNQPGYCATKAALLGLSKSVVLEYARFGITSNCILPGFTATEKVQAMPESLKDALQSTTPAGRFGQLDEVVSLIRYLLSEQAGYVNGSEIDVGGGAHLNMMDLGPKNPK